MKLKKKENEKAVLFKNTKREIFWSIEDEEYYSKTSFFRHFEKNIGIDKVRDHCHLPGNYRGAASSSKV